MKNKAFLLFKTNFINSYKLKATSNKKKIMTLILIIYIIGCLGFSIKMFMENLLKNLTDFGMQNYYITILFIVASIFAFIFSIFSAKSSLFDNKDNDLLLSIPVNKKEILTSRLLMIICYNFLIGLVFIIPGIMVYVTKITSSTIQIISIILLTLFFCIIPTVLSCLFGYLIAVLTSKTNKKSFFELLYYVLFIALYFLIITNANKILISLISNEKLFNTILKTIFSPMYLIYKGLATNNIIYILGFASLNIIILALFILIMNKSYFKIISKLNSHKTNSHYKMNTLKIKSIKKTLLEKESKRYFSSAIYVFNTIFGVVIILIAAIASFVFSPEKITNMVDLGSDINSFSFVYLILLFTISLTITTNSSISIERDNFWILKMIPVKIKDIFNAKLTFNRLIIIPITIISLILFSISGYITIIEMILLIILTIIYALFISNFGLIVNLMFPNLNAVNDAVIVKQSVSSMVGIFGGIIIFVIILLVSSQDGFSNALTISISILISLILYVISKVLLKSWGEKKFKEIN